MPLISQSSIQELHDRLDAVAVVSDYVQMEKRGGRFWGRCPFHQEKTGSFTVNPDIKTYYCFGCHKGGTIINFVMEMDKLSFPETIEVLAKRFSVDLVYENSGGENFSAENESRKKAREELYDLYQRISGTFHHFLLKKPESEAAKLYIRQRGINADMIERFALGYSPADRRWLHNFLTRKGYSGEFLAASGLFSSRNSQASLFSGRLMFPIADRQGRIVAFGGRLLPGVSAGEGGQERGGTKAPSASGWEPPKYINSPEQLIYKKGETLYAVDLALPEIRRTKTAYIAEGYMDVIALHQAGICNAVAPLGTAFTDEQAKLLKRWAEKIVFFFDSDGAGQSAALKGIYTCRKNGLSCALVAPESADEAQEAGEKAPSEEKSQKSQKDLPGLKDPADILRYAGPGALQKRAKNFINDFDYLLTRARSLYDASGSGGPDSVQGKAQATAFLFPYIDLLDSEVARGACIEAAADVFGLLPALVTEDYLRYASGEKHTGRGTPPRGAEVSGQPEEARPIRMNSELSLLTAVALNFVSPGAERIFPKFRAALEINEIEDANAKELFIALEECTRYGESSMDELMARISSLPLKKTLVERGSSGEFSVHAEQLVKDGIMKIKERRLERRQNEIIVKLRTLKKNTREDARSTEEKELLAEKMQIDGELYNLKQGRHA